MKRLFWLVCLVISCPTPGIKKIPEVEYLKNAEKTYYNNPIYAYKILRDNVVGEEYRKERAKILLKIYLDQREYERAAILLDSLNWSIPLNESQTRLILLKTKRWDKIAKITNDNLLKGIAYYQLGEYQRAIESLSKNSLPDDYRILYLSRAYRNTNDFENSFKALLGIDSISPYLFGEYQNLLFDLLLKIEDFNTIQKELGKLKQESLKEYILLKFYEKNNEKKNIKKTAQRLIKKYPKSQGAYYALHLIKPRTKLEYKLSGKVYYYHHDYGKAIEHFKKSYPSDEVNYYLGRAYYNKKNYQKALGYFKTSDWAGAYYYRGRIYEKLSQSERAIIIYDSLNSFHKGTEYAIRGQKRKAFLLEDIGDTLSAVKTFLKIDEENARFRAAMQLFRIGRLNEADGVLKDLNVPEFIYWRRRVKERLGETVDSLRNELNDQFPLSYYSLVRDKKPVVFDTTSLSLWIRQLGDTASSFDNSDSLHIRNAIRFFRLNETYYAQKELNMINTKGPKELLFLSRLCASYGADRQSINYCLKLKRLAERNNIRRMPREFFRLLYPMRYGVTIAEQRYDPNLLLAMIWQESLFDPNAISTANAQGLMQIIPGTASTIAQELGYSSYSLSDASTSIEFGAHYLKNILKDLNSVPLSLAAYNAGPVRVKNWIINDPNSEIAEFIELIPYNETRHYVKSVLRHQAIYQQLY